MAKEKPKVTGSPLIVALDTPSIDEALDWCRLLLPEVDFFKIGLELFYSHGVHAVRSIKDLGGRVFLDLKLHDIPRQVRQTASLISQYGVDMFTVHCLGGRQMLESARRGAKEGGRAAGQRRPLVIGVTVLSSLDAEDLQSLGIDPQVEIEVGVLTALARDSGLDGVVASGRELVAVGREMEKRPGESFLCVVPGIRPGWMRMETDQKRTLSPKEAIELGADYVVVGRPIIRAERPKAAALRVLEELA